MLPRSWVDLVRSMGTVAQYGPLLGTRYGGSRLNWYAIATNAISGRNTFWNAYSDRQGYHIYLIIYI